MNPDDIDTSDVSAASTPPPDEDQEFFDVEDILAERQLGDGSTQYLIKWHGYPMSDCTWEPYSHIEDTTLPSIWQDRKATRSEAEFAEYNAGKIQDYENHVDEALRAKQTRAAKRAKKRAQQEHREPVRRPVFVVSSSSDSDDDAPLATRRRSAGAAITANNSPLFMDSQAPTRAAELSSSEDDFPVSRRRGLQKGTDSKKAAGNVKDAKTPPVNTARPQRERSATSKKAKKPPERRQSLSSMSSAASDELIEVAKPIRANNILARANASASSRPTASDQPVQGARSNVAQPSSSYTSSAVQSTARKDDKRYTAMQKKAPTSSAGHVSSEKLNVATSTVAPRTKTIATIKRTAPGPIALVNKAPSTLKRDWQNSDGLYKKLSTRRKGQVRAHKEQEPDYSALTFPFGAPTGKPPTATIAHASSTRNDNDLYGRRDRGTRRLQQEEEPEKSPENESAQISRPKIRRSCWEWRNRSCAFSSANCWFMHEKDFPISPSNFAGIPPKFRDRPITCYSWMTNPKGCKFSADACLFAHENTGLLRIPDSTPKELDPDQTPQSHILSHAKAGPWPAGDVSIEDRSKESKPPWMLTCFFWSRGNCRRGNTCIWAHEQTGELAPPPRGWVDKSQPYPSADERSAFNAFSAGQKQPESSWRHSIQGSSESVAIPRGLSDVSQVSTTANQCLATHESTSGFHDVAMVDDAILATASMDLGADTRSGVETVRAPSTILQCADLESLISRTFNLDYQTLFRDDHDVEKSLAPLAFVLFHPENEHESAELITRWLLMHHVEVFPVWLPGSWEYFLIKVAAQDSGIIVASPDYYDYCDLPKFWAITQSHCRIWAAGYQEPPESPMSRATEIMESRTDCVELFPFGGLIYITDEVFEKSPELAYKIIKLFVEKIEKLRGRVCKPDNSYRVVDAFLIWRLIVRPNFMERTHKWVMDRQTLLQADDENVQWRAKIWWLLCHCDYINRNSSAADSPKDYWPIISENGDHMDIYDKHVKSSQEQADFFAIEGYSVMMLAPEMRRRYRHFYVVHLQPNKVRHWQQTLPNISDFITPEQCINYLQQSEELQSHEAKFSFGEFELPEKPETESKAFDWCNDQFKDTLGTGTAPRIGDRVINEEHPADIHMLEQNSAT